jgi:hypothetical protein
MFKKYYFIRYEKYIEETLLSTSWLIKQYWWFTSPVKIITKLINKQKLINPNIRIQIITMNKI